MMGPDVERILGGINSVKDETTGRINLLAEIILGSINSIEFILPIVNAITAIKSDCTNMTLLKDGLYVDSTEFNNQYGSPWSEFDNLNKSITNIKKYAEAHPVITIIEEKVALLGLLNVVLSSSIDAKWALTMYHDYIQRGYDHKFNDDKPSITFTSGIDKETIGNIYHEYSENVNIEQPSIDPF